MPLAGQWQSQSPGEQQMPQRESQHLALSSPSPFVRFWAKADDKGDRTLQ